MSIKKVFVCQDSVEGILTGIYQAWASRNGHENNRIQIAGESNFELFCEYEEVEPDDAIAEKVISSIRKKISRLAYEHVYKALMTRDPMKGDYVYRFMILGFHIGKEAMNCLSYDPVNEMMRLSQRVSNESHHYKGFIRFQQISGNIMLSRIRPDNNIVAIMAPHFADRFSTENWIIYDEDRKIAAVHEKGKEWFLVQSDQFDEEKLGQLTNEEEELQKIWSTFVSSISIKERENPSLQMNMLPLRYREFMNEFHQD